MSVVTVNSFGDRDGDRDRERPREAETETEADSLKELDPLAAGQARLGRARVAAGVQRRLGAECSLPGGLPSVVAYGRRLTGCGPPTPRESMFPSESAELNVRRV